MANSVCTPLARTHDPDSSHIAAAKAERFSHALKRRILAVLNANQKPMTAGEIGQVLDLDNVPVSRRLSGLRDEGKVMMGKVRKCDWKKTQMAEWTLVK